MEKEARRHQIENKLHSTEKELTNLIHLTSKSVNEKQLSIAWLLLSFVIVTKGQQPPAPPNPPSIEERMKRTNEMLQREVAPTTAQKATIEKAYREFFAKEDKLRKENPPPAQPGPPPAKVKEAMDKLVKERDEKVKKILIADQYKKYTDAIKKQRPPGMPGQPGPRPS